MRTIVHQRPGLAALTRQLALEWAPEVRVNGIAPGLVLPRGPAERLEERIPLGHAGTPEDVARAVVYLAQAGFVTARSSPSTAGGG